MLTKVIQFMGPALKSRVVYQTGRWPGRAVSHKRLHQATMGEGPHRPRLALWEWTKDFLRGLRTQVFQTESWEFDGGGSECRPSHQTATQRGFHDTEKSISNRWHACVTVVRRDRNSAFGIRYGSPAQPILLSGPVSSSVKWESHLPVLCWPSRSHQLSFPMCRSQSSSFSR